MLIQPVKEPDSHVWPVSAVDVFLSIGPLPPPVLENPRPIGGRLLDSKKATMREKMSEFFNRSIEEGRMQDFVSGGALNP